MNTQSRQALSACGDPQRELFLDLKNKVGYRRLSPIEDPGIPLFPELPADEERNGAESFLWNVASRRGDSPPVKWGRGGGPSCRQKFWPT
jgi:hypothetical protein